MRQAGRSLPEYRSMRGTGNILDAIRDPEVAAELTLQPVRRHGVDAAILFSDIVVPVEAIGFGVRIEPGRGPVIEQPFRSPTDLARLRPLEPGSDIPYVTDAIKLLVDQLDPLGIPLIGFAGAPFTVASYLVEGGPSKNFTKSKTFMRSDPRTWNSMLDRLADIAIASLEAQVQSGASAVQVFDSWAGSLGPSDYRRFVLPHSQKVFSAVSHLGVPSIHFGVGTGELLGAMAEAGPDVVGVDWRVPIDVARERIGPGRAVQGNLDPVTCLAPWEVVEAEANDILRRGGGRGHIFNLGHGVLPETDPEVLTRLVDLVHDYKGAPGDEMSPGGSFESAL